MGQRGSKTCRTCYSVIESRARACPECGYLQCDWPTVVRQPAAYGFLLLVVGCGLLGEFQPQLDTEGVPYDEQIEVLESELRFGELEGMSTVAVVGRMRNKSDVDWKAITFRVSFFDDEQTAVDAQYETDDWFVLASKDSSAFKLSFPRELSKERYVSHNVRITRAKSERVE